MTGESTVAELRDQLTEFLSHVDRASVVEQISAETGTDPAEVERRLNTYLNEPFVALDLVAPHLGGVTDILEIGAGIGAFSAFLSTLGYNVLAIEPAGVGFDFMTPARRALDAQWPSNTRQFLPIEAERLGPEHGSFDLAFSVHVLEHVDDVAAVIESIHGRLRASGSSVHICPNYAVPYEPHFGLPLLPVRPAASRHVLPRRVTTSGLWESINFITARQIDRIAGAQHLRVTFRRGVMADMASRVSSDAIFRDRHGLAGRLATFVVGRPIGRRALEEWPPTLATPMTFTLSDSGTVTEPGASD